MDEHKCTTLATLNPQECGIDSTNARGPRGPRTVVPASSRGCGKFREIPMAVESQESGTATAAARAIAAGALGALGDGAGLEPAVEEFDPFDVRNLPEN